MESIKLHDYVVIIGLWPLTYSIFNANMRVLNQLTRRNLEVVHEFECCNQILQRVLGY